MKSPRHVLWFVVSAIYVHDGDSKLREGLPRCSHDAGVYGCSVTGCNKTCSCPILEHCIVGSKLPPLPLKMSCAYPNFTAQYLLVLSSLMAVKTNQCKQNYAHFI